MVSSHKPLILESVRVYAPLILRLRSGSSALIHTASSVLNRSKTGIQAVSRHPRAAKTLLDIRSHFDEGGTMESMLGLR